MVGCTYKLTIQGTVQGVGFRPFIYTLAKRYNLNGTVSNGSNGVEIFVNASKEILEQFIETIQDELPSLAYINSLDIEEMAFQNF
jgi:hydrogenase maturation protein HypF